MVASRSASWAQGMGSGAASYQAEGDMILSVTRGRDDIRGLEGQEHQPQDDARP
jgi:hypothetical protein